MYKYIGWLNIILVSVMLLPFVLQFFLNKLQGIIYRFSRIIKRPHRIFGIVLPLLIFLHGYFALGGFYFNTGTSALLVLIICVLFGIMHLWIGKKAFYKVHRFMVVIFLMSVVFHLIYPEVLDWLELIL